MMTFFVFTHRTTPKASKQNRVPRPSTSVSPSDTRETSRDSLPASPAPSAANGGAGIFIKCRDSLSGEEFEVADGSDAEVEASIVAYIRDGMDDDSGTIEYDVTTSDGRYFGGAVTYRE